MMIAELKSRSWLRSPRVGATTIATAAIITVVTFWSRKGFYLHFRGDATSFPRRCGMLGTSPIEWFTSFQALRTTFQVPYCVAYEIGGIRAWILVQIGLWALTCVLIYRATAVLFQDERAGLLAGFALVPLWETFRFAIRPQDDMMLLAALALALYVLARERDTSNDRWHALAVLALLILSFSRPFALPIAAGLIGWWLWRGTRSRGPSLGSLSSIVLVVILLVLGAFLIGTFLLHQLRIETATEAAHWRDGLTAAWANGIVVTHPGTPTFEYIYQPRSASTILGWLVWNADHLMIMALFKAAFFFVPVLPRWSTFHILVNAVTVFPLMVGAAGGTAALLNRGLYEQASLVLVPIVMTLVTVGGFFLDGGFNYRAPATLSFAMLSGYWASQFLELQYPAERVRRAFNRG